MSETQTEKVSSGTYRPKQDVTLTVWNDGEEPPEGFDIQRTSDGSQIAVKMHRGEPARDEAGNAAAMPEGGALAEFPDGTYVTLAGDDLDEFLRSYESTDGNNTTPSTSHDSAGAAADAAAASPTTTTTTPNVADEGMDVGSTTAAPDATATADNVSGDGQNVTGDAGVLGNGGNLGPETGGTA